MGDSMKYRRQSDQAKNRANTRGAFGSPRAKNIPRSYDFGSPKKKLKLEEGAIITSEGLGYEN